MSLVAALLLLAAPAHAIERSQPIGMHTVQQIVVGLNLGWTFGPDGGFTPGLHTAWMAQRVVGHEDAVRPLYGATLGLDVPGLKGVRSWVAGRGGLNAPVAGDRTFFERFGAAADLGLAVSSIKGFGPYGALGADAFIFRVEGRWSPAQPSVVGAVDLPLRPVGSAL